MRGRRGRGYQFTQMAGYHAAIRHSQRAVPPCRPRFERAGQGGIKKRNEEGKRREDSRKRKGRDKEKKDTKRAREEGKEKDRDTEERETTRTDERSVDDRADASSAPYREARRGRRILPHWSLGQYAKLQLRDIAGLIRAYPTF